MNPLERTIYGVPKEIKSTATAAVIVLIRCFTLRWKPAYDEDACTRSSRCLCPLLFNLCRRVMKIFRQVAILAQAGLSDTKRGLAYVRAARHAMSGCGLIFKMNAQQLAGKLNSSYHETVLGIHGGSRNAVSYCEPSTTLCVWWAAGGLTVHGAFIRITLRIKDGF
jgi:hypothetical protein